MKFLIIIIISKIINDISYFPLLPEGSLEQ